MSASTYKIWSATTAALIAPPVAVASASTVAVKTIQQLKLTQTFRVIEWGYILAALAPAPCDIELVDVGAIAATMPTAYAAGDIPKYANVSQADSVSSIFTLGTGASGFGQATAEGTVTATRLLDYKRENGMYIDKQYPLSREPEVAAANYLRVRVTPSTAASFSIVSYITIET